MRSAVVALTLIGCGRFGFDTRVGTGDAGRDAIVFPDGLITGFTAIDVGGEYSCGIWRDRAYCWGGNSAGELGTGDTTPHATPFPVALPAIDVVQLTAGNTHACATLADGSARCWGTAMLGDGVSTSSPTPVVVAGLPAPVTEISAGYDFTCALAAGDVYCWGDDSSDRLGNGPNGSTPVPVRVLVGPAHAVFAGGDHACAVDAAGAGWCWGHNDGPGALGIGSDTPANAPSPLQVVDLVAVTDVTIAGYHTCAIDSGGAWCWGTGTSGELGDGGTSSSNRPRAVAGLATGVTAIHTGGGPSSNDSCCAVKDHELSCWGSGDWGRLGTGTTNNQLLAMAVPGLPASVSAVAVGWYHTCAIVGGDATCWGRGTSGQLGDGGMATSYSPVLVTRPQ
jgi:alpha-tubulin suppressor-like RCC1 family protein